MDTPAPSTQTKTRRKTAQCQPALSAEELEYHEQFLDALTAAKVLYWRQHLDELRELVRQAEGAATAPPTG